MELLGAMAAGLVVLVATLQSLSFFQREFSRQQARMSHEQDLRLGLELLEQELQLALPGSLSIILPNELEFTANVLGLITNVSVETAIGQSTIIVNDGRGWPDRKTVHVCWGDQRERFMLARAGQRNLLTLTEPIPLAIPSGASVAVMNRVRYYSRREETGSLKLLRQFDGGASVLAGDIKTVNFSYWDEKGRITTNPALVKRVVVKIALFRNSGITVREISLRT